MSISIRDIFKNPEDFLDKEIVLSGWVKTSRASKTLVLLNSLMEQFLNQFKLFMVKS